MKVDEVVIETDRLVLRKMRIEDHAVLLSILGDPNTMVHYPRPFSSQSVTLWIQRILKHYHDHGYGLYIVVLKATGEVIGECGFWIQYVNGVKEVEIGYHFGHFWWGNGYASEAARACRDYAFDSLGETRLIALIKPANEASKRLAKRIGMTMEKEAIKEHHRLVFSISKAARDEGQTSGIASP